MYKTLINGLKDTWSATGFAAEDLAFYAHKRTLEDAQQGLAMLSLLLLGLFGAELGLYAQLEVQQAYFYTLGLLALLCIHVAVSSRVMRDIKSIYMLGATLLMISGTAFVLLAHQTGTLNLALFASVTLLFMVIPLVPWGLREGLIVAGLIYATFTISTWSAPSGFDRGALWSLQFMMLGAGFISLALVIRNASVRKADIRARFELEKAHHQMMHLSHKDPLTGAWNRRYLKIVFANRIAEWRATNRTCHFAVLDIDNFKPINDNCGHDYGDKVLGCVADAFRHAAGQDGCLIRMGGDEFALLFATDDPAGVIESALMAARQCSQPPQEFSGLTLEMSIGMVSIPSGIEITQEETYREADLALYEAKGRKDRFSGAVNLVVRTLQDKQAAEVPLTV